VTEGATVTALPKLRALLDRADADDRELPSGMFQPYHHLSGEARRLRCTFDVVKVGYPLSQWPRASYNK
jgi:hypothetical protein